MMTPLAASHTTPTMPSVAVPWQDMLAHRDYLVRFAQRKLHDPCLAEDVVHDVFEAVVAGRADFAGRSSLRSWLTAILKHKIVDLVRQRACMDSLDDGDGEDMSLAMACDSARPDELAQHREALRHVMQGIAALPGNLRDVIQLRVLQDQSAQEVCQALAITENNLFQRLFRARQSLAGYLQGNVSMALH